MSCLRIKDLHISVDRKEILEELSLDIHSGKTHAPMEPNGNGKSTLLVTIMGNPKFRVTGGSIILNDQDVLAMEIDGRSKAGLLLGVQYPSGVSGAISSGFLRAVTNARRERPTPLPSFIHEMEKTIRDLQTREGLARRFLNEGFSSGERRRSETIQAKLLKPPTATLDEIDSGLDVGALKIVAEAVTTMQRGQNMGFVTVSHYACFYELLKPIHAHILVDGRVVVSGGNELVEKIDQQNYDWIGQEHDVQVVREKEKKVEPPGSRSASRGA